MDNARTTEWIVLMAMFIHLMGVPFTKVEESFNMQALHDILYLRGNLSDYDHNKFPGVVPRTFTGPLFISSLLFPLMPIFSWASVPKYWVQFTARTILGVIVSLAFFNFARCVEKHFGRNVGTFVRIIAATQFHFLFYASRTLPNTFALILVLWVYEKWLDGKNHHWIILATVATFLFRCELALLFGPFFLAALFLSKYRFYAAFWMLLIGLSTLLVTLAVTVPIDSFFWNKWLWPEGDVAYFNIWLNKSGEYGVQPFWWYFTSALPRTLLFSIAFIPLGFLIQPKKLSFLLVPALSFILLYSNLPHKELRFILYVIPLLNVPVAVFCSWVWQLRSYTRYPLRLLIALHLAGNLFLTCVFIYSSAGNYPGGEALTRLQISQRYFQNKPVSIHFDGFCAQSGVTRFTKLYDKWEYNKTEDLTVNELKRFDYLLLGSQLDVRKTAASNFSDTHREYFAVRAFDRLRYISHLPLALRTYERIFPEWIRSHILFPSLEFRVKVIVLKKKQNT